MNESTKTVITVVVTLGLFALQAFFGIRVSDLTSFQDWATPEVTEQREQIEAVERALAVQDVRIQTANELNAEFTNQFTDLVRVHVEGGDSNLADRLVQDARAIADGYRDLMREERQKAGERERTSSDATARLHEQVRSALVELDAMKRQAADASLRAVQAAEQANATPRYVMIEDEGASSAFWLPHEGAFSASLDDIVKGPDGVPIAHVAIASRGDDAVELRLPELGPFRPLPDTRWSVRPALVYDSLTLFGRRRVVILELIPSRLVDDRTAVQSVRTFEGANQVIPVADGAR